VELFSLEEEVLVSASSSVGGSQMSGSRQLSASSVDYVASSNPYST
jgi:hypothetical protein